MGLYAIGDLHLPGGDQKPMDVFGAHWENHFDRIRADWRARVSEDDTVLIPGDISWAMQMRDALDDLARIDEMPGCKLILKGNHDYWWSSITQLRQALPPGIRAIQNDAVDVGEAVVCGSRGWVFPTGASPLSPEDQKICQREQLRLEMSLQAGEKLAAGRPLVVMMHYPPLYDMERDTCFTALLEKHPVHTVVYGHLHGAGIRVGFTGEHRGVRYRLVSCDSLDFCLAEVPLTENAHT